MVAYYQVNKQYKSKNICVTKVTLPIGNFGTLHVGSFSNLDILFAAGCNIRVTICYLRDRVGVGINYKKDLTFEYYYQPALT